VTDRRLPTEGVELWLGDERKIKKGEYIRGNANL
jgi:hypothetical protein